MSHAFPGTTTLVRTLRGSAGLLFLLGALACGGGGGGGSTAPPPPPPAAISVQVAPTPGPLTVEGTRAFTAQVSGSTDTRVTWRVAEGAAGGTISATGVYQAPATPGTYTVVAQSVADNTRSGSTTIRVVDRPSIARFEASPAGVTFGQSTTLTWSVSGAATLKLDGQPESSDHRTLTPLDPHVYVLEAVNEAGTTVQASVEVPVVPPPVIRAFTCDADTLTTGQAATFQWQVDGAQELRFDGAPVTGTQITLAPATAGDHTLEARNSLGFTVQATLRLTLVPPPVISSFTADATALTAGQSTTLRWAVGQASELRLDGQVVTGTSAPLTPATTGDHVLEARNSLGAVVQATVRITVVPAPAITSFTADATSLTDGESTTLRWSVAQATELRLDGQVVTGTSAPLTPTGTGDHVLEVRNSLGFAVQATVQVTVVPKPVITTFAPARTSITASESTQLSWSATQATELRLDGTPVTGTSLAVSPGTTTTYVLEARNSLGYAVTASATVTVVPAPTLTFSASASGFEVGGSSVLSWTASGASTLTLDGAPVTGSSRTVTPYRTTTYTLRAANALGFEVTRTATVTVNPYPGQVWMRDGQVWLKWKDTLPLSGTQTYDVYRSEAPITSLASATLVGRLLPQDLTADRLKLADPAATWVIPAPGGGTLTLASDEAHFTATPQAAATAFYAVIVHGGALNPALRFGPIDESLAPITAHPQRTGTDSGRTYTDYALWVDGRAGTGTGRADFPVMGPPSFNGMATLFRVYQSPTPAGLLPAVLMMHGNGGSWLNFHPTASDTGFDLDLDPGLVVTLDDALYYNTGSGVDVAPTRWFGSWDGFDRFSGVLATPPNNALVHPYTLRRCAWIRDWLVRDLGADPDRVLVAGHSMGALGAATLARFAPEKFSATLALLFHTTIPSGTFGDYLRGTDAQNLPTSLGVTMREVHDPTVALSLEPLPVTRYLWGVADGTIPWTDKPAKIAALDAARAGVQIWWDERLHNPAWSGHFVGSTSLRIGSLAPYRRSQSFPGFSQEVSVDADTSHSWGTRGGYLEWDPATLTESATGWSVDLWLRSAASLPADVPAFATVTVDVSLRRPQAFKPAPGAALSWSLVPVAGGAPLQSGTLTVGGDGLVTVPALVIPKAPAKARLTVSY